MTYTIDGKAIRLTEAQAECLETFLFADGTLMAPSFQRYAIRRRMIAVGRKGLIAQGKSPNYSTLTPLGRRVAEKVSTKEQAR